MERWSCIIEVKKKKSEIYEFRRRVKSGMLARPGGGGGSYLRGWIMIMTELLIKYV